jgi:hypothetical protein
MKIEFAFTPPAVLPPFVPDYGSMENVASGPDIDLLKKFLAVALDPTATVKVLHTKRQWKSRSSFIEHRAIVEVRKPRRKTADLFLVVLKGYLRETVMSIYKIVSPKALHQDERGTPAPKWRVAKPLPSAEDLRMIEKYPDRHPATAEPPPAA